MRTDSHMKSFGTCLSLLTALSLFEAFAATPAVGERTNGFVLRGIEDLPDGQGRLWRMEHEKTGADLVWLERDDENRTFAVAFKTIPDDHTGIPHILEHAVLCGSERFPVKDPFVELLRGSLSTFLNAMTSADVTVYPIATKNDREFLNLTDVYLDAVLRPLAVKDDLAFRQEGWHDEYDGTNLVRNGVVYSEMKGSFGNPDSVGYYNLRRLLFPDTTYGCCSGGDPAHIPELTYERFRAFHARFYHPSNARLFLDGKVKLAPTLVLLDHHLSAFERQTPPAEIPLQKPVFRTAELRYACAHEDKRTILWDGWVYGTYAEPETTLALEALTEVLAGSNEAPLKRALLDAGLCEDVALDTSGQLQQAILLVIRNTDPDKAASCRRTVRETLERLCRDGLDRARLAAILNRLEFVRRENDTSQRGIRHLYTALDTWLYGGDPSRGFRFAADFARLRERLATDWYERLLRQALLDNPHHTELTLRPSATLAAERAAAEKAENAARLARLTEDEKAALLKETQTLKQRQTTPDRPEDLAKLPRLSIRDVSADDGFLPRGEILVRNGTTVLRPHAPVRGLFYLDLCFSLEGLSDDELRDAAFLAVVLGELKTKDFTALALRNELDAKLGRFETYVTSTRRAPLLTVHVSALDTRRDDVLRLVGEILLDTRYDDTEAVDRLRRQRRDELEREAAGRGLDLSAREVRRGTGRKAHCEELFAGISQLRRLQAGPSGNLAALARRIFVRPRLTISLTDNQPMDFADRLIARLPTPSRLGDTPAAKTAFTPATVNEGYVSDNPVAFCAAALRMPTNVPYSGAQRVAAQIVSLDYLWPELRVKGGAYGGRMNVDRDGTVTLQSWRDPKPANTFKVFAGAGPALAALVGKADSIESYQLSTLAKTDPSLSPRQEASLFRELYFERLTPDDVLKTRREILATEKKDLLTFAEALRTAGADASRCAFARQDLLNACRFGKTETIRREHP